METGRLPAWSELSPKVLSGTGSIELVSGYNRADDVAGAREAFNKWKIGSLMNHVGCIQWRTWITGAFYTSGTSWLWRWSTLQEWWGIVVMSRTKHWNLLSWISEHFISLYACHFLLRKPRTDLWQCILMLQWGSPLVQATLLQLWTKVRHSSVFLPSDDVQDGNCCLYARSFLSHVDLGRREAWCVSLSIFMSARLNLRRSVWLVIRLSLRFIRNIIVEEYWFDFELVWVLIMEWNLRGGFAFLT